MPRRRSGKPGTTVLIAFAVMLTLVLAGGLILYGNGRVLVESSDWVSHTQEVKGELQDISSALTEAESSERGFLLTLQPAYLNDYRASLLKARAGVSKVGKLTQDNPTQQRRLETLVRLINGTVNEMDALMATGDKGFDAARSRLLSGRARAEMASIRDAVSRMEQQEGLLLAQRSKDAQKSLRRAVLAFWAGLAVQVLALLGLLALASRIIRILFESRNMEQRNRAELERQVELRTAELRASNEELESFSASVSHDLQSPLRHISATAAMLREDIKPKLSRAEDHEFDLIAKEVRRMGQLIEDLLRLSRTARGAVELSEVDLTAMAQQVCASLLERNPDKPFEYRIQPGLKAHADARMTQILLENLIGNAHKYSSKVEHSFIEVGDATAKDEHAFFVRDNGAGFDPKLKPKLFESFSRLHSDKEFEGSGLGLAICKKIVGRHGGRIWAESEAGKGATFYFTLQPGVPSKPSSNLAETLARWR